MRRRYQRVLMVYPAFFPTYWGMNYALELEGRKASMPPLGLLTIAALTPEDYEVRLVDMNCGPLSDEDLAWADLVVFSAMLPQKATLIEAARRCREAGKLVVFGGPYPTACPEECAPFCDVQVLYEGEVNWPSFLRDLEAGRPQALYDSRERPDLSRSPCPRFDLLKVEDYRTIPIQFSRGCPFQCEFCDIIVMFGRRPRTKTPEQMFAELDAIHATGFRGRIFVVDDNFIGHRREVRKLLPEMARWNRAHGRPFRFGTQASVDLAGEAEVLRGMREADFVWVFLGVETPSAEGLRETGKTQNLGKRSLTEQIRVIQEAGLLVIGGFIIGFDSDTEDIFDRQIEFITRAAIPCAMIGPLVALPGTPLHARLRAEGRLREGEDDHGRTVASGYTNIITKLPRRALLEGHRRILRTLYAPRAFFNRATEALLRLPKSPAAECDLRKARERFSSFCTGTLRRLPQAFRSEAVWFARRVLASRPEQLPEVMTHVVLGYHFFRFTFDHMVPELTRDLAECVAVSESLDLASASRQPRAEEVLR